MLIRTEEDRLKRLAEAKEIKVKIPLEFHIKLHTLKVLKGQSISDTVELALGRYFQALTVEMATAAPAAESLMFHAELAHPEMPH
ncbi:MAG: hypothetical protein LC624_01380 [Halobacteriales archaeon]|nr:hypothetical protein [Halobacteriales archaeon]